MTTAAQNPAILPRARRDLRLAPIEVRGQQYWTVKDPVSLRYYQLRAEERFILGLLDGSRGLEEIIGRFEQRFAPRRLRMSDLSGFLATLHREGLVIAPAWAQGEQLLIRQRQQRWEQALTQLMNVLAIRLPGINPDRWLNLLAPRFAWVFSTWCAVITLALMLAALVVAIVNFGALQARLPTFLEFFGPTNIGWLVIALALVKTLHEFGHALACKHFGGECNRLGVILLLFVPALYCDVSDAWMIPQRGRRIAVSAAGMVVELVLASVATLLWAMTAPGWFNALCLNILFVCSVGTLLINGNPLLRYDGYYILADLVGAPNLRHQASASMRRHLARLLAGVELIQPRLLAEPGQGLLWAYGIGSMCYRLLVLFSVLYLIHAALAARGLSPIAHGMMVLVAAAVSLGPAKALVAFLRDPSRRRNVRPLRLLASLAVLGAGMALVLSIPLPSRVTAPLVLRPQGAMAVYVTSPGMLETAVAPGQTVARGEILGRLRSGAAEAELLELDSRVRQQRLHVRQLEVRRHDLPSLGDQLPAAQTALRDYEEQLSQMKQELARLTLRSPASGVVLPPPVNARADQGDQLSSYTGTPLDPENLGCRLEAGELFCQIGDPSTLEAVVIVDESDVQRLRPGQRVRLCLAEIPGQILSGRLEEIARANALDLPPELLASGMLPRASVNGRNSSVQRYQALVALENPAPVLTNATGWARIQVDPQPLGLHLYRGLRGTFRLPW